MFYSEISFDWYEATVFFGSVSDYDTQVFDGNVDVFISDMLDDFNHVYSVKPVISRNGWRNAVVLHNGTDVFCRLSWNNPSAARHCLSVQFTGSHATKGADWLRVHFPEHNVTRCDIAADTCFDLPVQPVTATMMFDDCISIAKEMGLSTSVIGDWFGDGGRTLYVGSPKSTYRMRIYEKGKQDDNSLIGGLSWVRFELVCRPDKKRRADAALLTPQEIMGSFKFAVRVLSIYYKQVDITDSLNKTVKHSADFNSSLEFMCRQYRNHLIQLNKSCNSVSEFGDKILSMVYTGPQMDHEHHDFLVALSGGGCTDFPPVSVYSDLF